MELKCFIKNVISDITNAVKESQEELKNGAIVSPMGIIDEGKRFKEGNSNLMVSYIDFDVSVTVSSSNETEAGIKVLASVLSGGVSTDDKKEDAESSRIRFSIPVVYPSHPNVSANNSHR